MKTQFKNYLYMIVVLCAVTALSCGGDDTPPPEDPRLAIQETLTSSGWSLANGGSISHDGNNVTDQYTGFTASFTVSTTTANTYSTTNSGGPGGQNRLFSASGTWTWADDTTTTMINLDDADKGTLTIVTLNETTFRFRFRQINNAGTAAGIEGLAGEYDITLTR